MKQRIAAAVLVAAAFLFSQPATAFAAQDVDHWPLEFLHAAEANAISQGEGVVVAIIDTGVDGTHPDLAGSLVPGVNFNAGSGDGSTDLDGHGTKMAGLIVGHGRMIGIAPKAKIMPLAADRSTNVYKAIDWAVDHGAGVINISLAAKDAPDLRASVNRALAAGVVIVAAGGNLPAEQSTPFPAAYDGVIAAAAVDRAGNHAAISVIGEGLVLAAPGEDVESTFLFGGYGVGDGTSDSAALISGVAALVRAKFPKLSGAEIYHRLVATADDKGAPGRDAEYGYGIVNPVKALTADVPPLATSAAPSVAATGQTAGSTGNKGLIVIGLAAVLVIALVVGIVVMTRRAR